MGRAILLMVMLIGCSSDPVVVRDCVELSMTVGQERGTCRLAEIDGGVDGCPIIFDAWCGNDEDCPLGWQAVCDSDENGDYVNCRYGDGVCVGIEDGLAVYTYFQILDGVRGLSVDIGDGRCEFRPCL